MLYWICMIVVAVMVYASQNARAGVPIDPITPGADELGLRDRWVAARMLHQSQTAPAPASGLIVLANHDPVTLNHRENRPLNLAGTLYTRGLYCHAVSHVLVRLPGPAQRFDAVVGIDKEANGGSVVFSVEASGQRLWQSDVLHCNQPGVPVSVDLNGAAELSLRVGDAGDGIACDQSDWANARVTLMSGEVIWLGDLPFVELQPRPEPTDPFFSFIYGGKPSSTLLSSWRFARSMRKLDDVRTAIDLIWTDPDTGLEVTAAGVMYSDFPVVEWTVRLRNTGDKDTPVIESLLGADLFWERPVGPEFTLHHARGTTVQAIDYEPLETPLPPVSQHVFAPTDGRPCAGAFPYFNVQWGNQGVFAVVGWPGQWSATFARDEANRLMWRAGQQLTHFVLKPGETARSPLIVLMYWQGDRQRAHNMWRRWMVTHNIPKQNGKPAPPMVNGCSSHQLHEMINANTANQKEYVDTYLAAGIRLDHWWMDAGWYVNRGDWPDTGTWEVDRKRFPNGLREISDHARAKGVKTLVWFEPERVARGTWLDNEHPEWLLDVPGADWKLLNLGDPAALRWVTDHIDGLLRSEGIDLYRKDYNIQPLAYWRHADTPDRQGMTEMRYVEGYLAYWDALRQRHPDMLIDSCASGGHRNDLETMRRSVPFLRSDYIMEPVGQQAHTHGLSFWLPYHGTGTSRLDEYEMRSMWTTVLIACWDIRDPKLDKARLKRYVDEWRLVAPATLGDYYPLTPWSIADDSWIGWQFHRPGTDSGVIQMFRRAGSPYESVRARLRGIDPAGVYLVRDMDAPRARRMSGRALLETGLVVTITQPRKAVVIHYRRTR